MNEPIFDHERLDVRIVSMLTRLVQRTATVSEGWIEYKYRDAENEYQDMFEQSAARQPDLRAY